MMLNNSALFHKHFGSHLVFDENDKIIGANFCVYAPHAKNISVIGDFNDWDYHKNPMEKISDEGVWHIFIPNIREYDNYKYEIITDDNKHLQKNDPFCFYTDNNHSSKIYHIDGYKWHDNTYLINKNHYEMPIFIYELHFESWRKKKGGEFYSYREMVDVLIPYVKRQGFTHIELLPMVESIDCIYACMSKYGEPKDFMYFIDCCHQADIGVIMDIVFLNGHCDLSKKEVRSVLISNICFWIEYFHIDGFRFVDIAKAIYLNGDKNQGINYHGIEFLRLLNYTIHSMYPEIIMIAEDATDFPMVTKPTDVGGLGFNYIWNIEWMNDILEYFEEKHLFRKYLHKNITFDFVRLFSEYFILPLSHYEVINGKKPLISKMPGDYWQKFANFRLLMGLLITYPGKKLIFMGDEFAHMDEWKEKEQLDWDLYNYSSHEVSNRFVRDLIALYKKEKALYETDHFEDGFLWIDENNIDQSIFSFIRKNKDSSELLVIILNCSPAFYEDFKIGVPNEGSYKEILNSDRDYYGGQNQFNSLVLHTINEKCHNFNHCLKVKVPPLGISILKFQN